MKTLKLKKDKLKIVQDSSDEIHGMQIILADLCKRRHNIEIELRKIIHKEYKKTTGYIIHYGSNGKIKSIEMKD